MDFGILGRRIQEHRTIREMSQAELAEQVGLSEHHISAMENGRRHPSLETLVRIANVLSVTADGLLVGNQYDAAQHKHKITYLMEDCSAYEELMLCLAITAIKAASREAALLYNAEVLSSNQNDE